MRLAKRERREAKAERNTRGRRPLIYRFCCRPPSTFHAARDLLRHVAFQFWVPPAHNESVCKFSNRDHNSFVRYRVLTRGQSGMLHGTNTTLRGDATRDDATRRLDAGRPNKEDKGNEDWPQQLQARTYTVYTRMHARTHACRDDIRCKDTEEKSQSNWQVWNMWPRPCKNIGPPSSLLNVYRSGAKPTHDRIFPLHAVVCIADSSSVGRTDLCIEDFHVWTSERVRI